MPLDAPTTHPEHQDEDHTTGFEITVFYNGLPPREIRVLPKELVKQALERAVAAFGNLPNAHMLSLYTAAGVELQDGTSIHDSGIRPHDQLLLRPSAVKGD